MVVVVTVVVTLAAGAVTVVTVTVVVAVLLTRREDHIDELDGVRDRVGRLAAHGSLALELGAEVIELSDRGRGFVRHVPLDAEDDATVERDRVHRLDIAGDIRETEEHVGEHVAGRTQQDGGVERGRHRLRRIDDGRRNVGGRDDRGGGRRGRTARLRADDRGEGGEREGENDRE